MPDQVFNGTTYIGGGYTDIGGGTLAPSRPGSVDSLFRDDTPSTVSEFQAGNCLGGGGDCNCPGGKSSSSEKSGEQKQERVTTLVGQILNPLFRSRQYGMSSYQAIAETPDFLFSNERTAYAKGKYGFFSNRKNKKGNLDAIGNPQGTTL